MLRGIYLRRGDPIDLVEVDAGKQRMLTASGDLVKVWALKGHKVLKELRCECTWGKFGFFAKHTPFELQIHMLSMTLQINAGCALYAQTVSGFCMLSQPSAVWNPQGRGSWC